uniref:Uncharacterized protein n=1 Tax=Callorhinchus milii TaxID=7868 RepID=A0A4W3JX67_CALMI
CNIQTLLHVAAAHGHAVMVSYLLSQGAKMEADINAKDRDARRPLHLAALVGDTPMADLLLSNHADANPLDKEKKTPLHLAASEGHLDFVSLIGI